MNLTFDRLVQTALLRADAECALVQDDVRLGRAELVAHVLRCQQRLRHLGIQRGSRLAFWAENSLDVVVLQLAAWSSGVVVTGLHPLAAPAKGAEFLDLLQPDLLVVSDRMHERLSGHRSVVARVVGLDTLSRAEDVLSGETTTDPAVLWPQHGEPADIATIAMSGGTTGAPKGVCRSQGAMAASLLTMVMDWEWPDRPRFLACAPVSHASGGMVPAALWHGGRVVVASGFAPADLAETVLAHKVTCTFLVPTMIYRLLEQDASIDPAIAQLETILYGAAPMDPQRMREAMDRFGPRFMQLYGQAEAPNTISLLRRADHDDHLTGAGVPTSFVRVRIVAEDGSTCEPGQQGEIHVQGPQLASGYLRGEGRWEPLPGPAGWLATGDVGVLEDGFLTLVGRTNDMIISGGFNLHPGEIEQCLREVPGLVDVAVVGVPHPDWGEVPWAFVVGEVDEDQAATLVRERLGSAWVPKRFCRLQELPLSALGKVDRVALRALARPVDVRATDEAVRG